MKSHMKILVLLTKFSLLLQVSSMKMMPDRGRVPPGYEVPYPNFFWEYTANDSRVSVYKPESELCCSGNVFTAPPNSYHRCCGSSQYDTTRQKCCNGVVHDLRPGFDCCNTEYFSIKEAKCCISPLDRKEILKQFPSNILGDIEAIHSTLCCGLRLYDSRTNICCSENHKRMPHHFHPPPHEMGARPYHRTSMPMDMGFPNLASMNALRFIIYEKKFKNTGCCKGRIYDRSQGTCAQENDRPLMHDANVHDTRFIQPHFPRPPIMDRCDKEEYNLKTQICCSRHTVENGTFNVVNKVHDKKWPSTACCGTEIYDYESQLCCNVKKIHEQNEDGSLVCCGDEVFDVKKEQCCEVSNAIVDVETLEEENDSCCGDEKIPYNSRKQMCCGNKVLDVPEDESNLRRNLHCCWAEDGNSEPTLYDIQKEMCCGGVKHDNKNRRNFCCGSQISNWQNEHCCEGEIFNKTSRNEMCCGKNLFDSMTHLCCDFQAGVVVPKKSRYEGCCGIIPFDYQKEVCCMSNSHPRGFPVSSEMMAEPMETAVFPRSTPTTSCCGLNTIDLETHQCCGSTPIESSKELCCRYMDQENMSFESIAVPKITPLARCCGKDAFDPQTERCCNHTVVPAEDDALICCGSSLFNPESQICCNGNVNDLENEKNLNCCGENVYDSAKQVCCKGAIKDIGDMSPPTDCCYPVPDEI